MAISLLGIITSTVSKVRLSRRVHQKDWEGGVHRAANKSQLCQEDDLNFRIETQIGHGVNRAKPELSAPLRGNQASGIKLFYSGNLRPGCPTGVLRNSSPFSLKCPPLIRNEWGADELIPKKFFFSSKSVVVKFTVT